MIICKNCFEKIDETFDVCPYCGYSNGDQPEEPYFLRPGTVLNDRYIVGMVIGFGGFGITYKAYDKNTNVPVAVKEYYYTNIVNRNTETNEVFVFNRKHEAEFRHFKERFLDEARYTAKFSSSSNIVNVYEFFEENNTAYMVMEYLEGETLNSKIKRENKVNLNDVTEVVTNISAALKSIHAENIIHRDISPDNIFLCKDKKIKLIDFGAARFSANESEVYSQLTKIMKPGFSPPEQYQTTNEQGPWTDVYALGATVYYALIGEKPIESTNRKIIDELVEPKKIDPNIPDYINNAIMRATAVDVHLRFQTIDEFESSVVGEKEVLSVAQVKKRRKVKRLVGISVASFLIVVATTIFLFSFNQQRIEETLPDSMVQMWYVLPSDEEEATAKMNSYNTIIDTFNESFPNVTINLEAFTEEEYEVEINEAYQQDNLPNLFESTSVSDIILQEVNSVETAVKSVDKKEVPFFSFYQNSFSEYKQFPVGFKYPIKYTNNSPKAIEEVLLPENSSERDVFLSGASGEYIGDTSDFFDVQASIPVLYTMSVVEDASGEFTDLWSMGECDDDQKRVVNRLLIFLLSDNAQDFLHIQYNSESLPLNEFTLINSYVPTFDDFKIIEEYIDDIEIE